MNVESLEIAALLPEEFARAAEIDVAAFGAGDVARRVAELEEEHARPWAIVRGARQRGALVGLVVAWHVADELHVLDVAVAPDRQRSGVARRLLVSVLDEARGLGVARCLLEVRRSNAPALALYASLGFSAFNERRAYYPDGEDAIELELRLS